MVRDQIEARGIDDPAVLSAMRTVPRHEFIPAERRAESYEDHAVILADGQTVSQPYIVALMTATVGLETGSRVLEIGTGSGYQAAVLAEIVERVFTVEVRPALHAAAVARLARLHYTNVECLCGDGHAGWPEHAPFDAILVTAAPPCDVPPALLDQLAEGGRLVVPVGERDQQLIRLEKRNGKLTSDRVAAVRFVPLVSGESLGS
jgi:protein-L-isoaspartate(D-aspartate) O-methyltransferase